MHSIGVDIGSAATKCALWDGSDIICCITPTGWTPKESAEAAVVMIKEKAGIAPDAPGISVTATGYGRNVFAADKRVTEISCHAAAQRVPIW